MSLVNFFLLFHFHQFSFIDETPINCERFLNNNGMEFFVSCMEKFPEYPGKSSVERRLDFNLFVWQIYCET